VFTSLNTVRALRRALLREGGYRSFLIPYSRVSVNNQSTYTTSIKLIYFRLKALDIAARILKGFVLLNAGPYRLKEGGL